eukprot:2861712-Rhodomonas_salina.1
MLVRFSDNNRLFRHLQGQISLDVSTQHIWPKVAFSHSTAHRLVDQDVKSLVERSQQGTTPGLGPSGVLV